MEGLSEKSIISPDYFYLFCAFFVSCIGSADFVPPDLPTSSLSKKKKRVILEVIEIRSPWKFAIGVGPNINTSLDVDTNLLTRVCVHPGLLLRGDFLSSI